MKKIMIIFVLFQLNFEISIHTFKLWSITLMNSSFRVLKLLLKLFILTSISKHSVNIAAYHRYGNNISTLIQFIPITCL